MTPGEEAETPVDPEAARQERRDFRFRHLLAHLGASRDWKRLFELVEERGFLADQADWFGGFQRPGEDVEEHVLPAAVAAGDWERFARFAAVAVNLRRLAEDLVDPEILAALASGGRAPLARDLAARLAAPLHRAEARAVLASTLGRGDPAFGALLREIADDLQAAAGGEGEERRSDLPSLLATARRLGPELDTLWASCLPRLTPSPEDAHRVRQAVAAAWLDRGDVQAEGLWRALAEIGQPGLLLEIAPERLAEMAADVPWDVLERLHRLLGADEEARRRAFARFLGRLARIHPELGVPAWDGWLQREEIPWSAELVEAGREWIARLDPDRLEALWAGIEDTSARAALRIVDLEARPDGRRAADALAALEEAPDALHWSLRYLAARPPETEEELRRKIDAAAGFLYELRYEADAGDLRLFLDLVARFRPDQLRAHLEGVVWSPASHPEALLALAAETESEAVAELLFANTERYAAAVAPNAAEGFQLRKELLFQVTAKLCLLRGSSRKLKEAAERLLPEEEDELRALLAPRLRSREVAQGIRDGRRRLLALLETASPGETGEDLLAVRSLYAALARVDSAEDEIQGLTVLRELPLEDAEPLKARLGGIRDPGIRLQALLRLAWHSLAFQERFYGGQPDRAAAVEMVRSGLTVDSDKRLVAATPQIAELGAQVGGSRAAAELEEASRRVLQIDSVSWPARVDALERLLALVPSLFLPPRERRGARRAAEILEALAGLPLQRGIGPAAAEIRERWHEILPLLAAALDRLPEKMAPRVQRVIRASVPLLPHPVPNRICELCALSPGERVAEIGRRLEKGGIPADELPALAFLLVVPAPARVREVLELLPEGPERDELLLRMARNGWLASEQAAALWLLASPEARQRLQARLADNGSREGWPKSLAALAARGEIDPADPRDEAVVRILWQRSSPECLEALALSVSAALRSGGRQRGEAALRLWLHARLAPRLGEVAAASDPAEKLRTALQQARTLGGGENGA